MNWRQSVIVAVNQRYTHPDVVTGLRVLLLRRPFPSFLPTIASESVRERERVAGINEHFRGFSLWNTWCQIETANKLFYALTVRVCVCVCANHTLMGVFVIKAIGQLLGLVTSILQATSLLGLD